ncbi:MAG: hypothetical protein SGCHY_002273 [Lobulomycetales sp.]
MRHAKSVSHIIDNGGSLLSASGELIDPATLKKGSLESESTSPIAYSRVYRKSNSSLKTLGVSSNRSLNLSKTIGDIVFKVHPAVMSSIPDITVISFKPSDQLFLLAASDGLFDHMIYFDARNQNDRLVKFVRDAWNPDAVYTCIPAIVKSLVDRVDPVLFADQQRTLRYDDVTVQLIVLH